MTTAAFYNGTRQHLWNVGVANMTLRLMLVDGTTVFSAAHTTLAQATGTGADEVSGNGWDVGGETLAGVATSIVSTNGVMLDATDVSVTATGGAIGPAAGAIVYDDADVNDKPLIYIDFEGDQTAAQDRDFDFVWNALGLARGLAPA